MNFSFDKMGKYFSALCNEANLQKKECGWLILGVNNQHQIVGTNYRRGRENLETLKSAIANHTTCNISFMEIYELKRTEGRVLLFKIPPAPKGIPIAWKGHWYGRNDEQLAGLNIQKIEEIRNQKIESDWSAQICKDASIADLSREAISKARNEFEKKNPNLSKEVNDWDDMVFLNKAKILINGNLTNAAIILLGKAESEHHISPSVSRITWVLKNEEGIEIDYQHFGPPWIINVDKVLSCIRNLRYRYLPDRSLFPIEITQYDPWVIREALHNCIAHQDYRMQGRISVVENLGALIFSNSGNFIPGDINNVINMDSPPEIYRNPFLANAMVNLNMIDTIGSGIKRMFTTQKDRYFPLPDYELSRINKVTVKITGKILDEKYTRLLIIKTDLKLGTVILLDKVQKAIKISKEEHRFLKARNLIEGRYPNLFLSSKIASVTEEKAKYIKYRSFDDNYYKSMILEFIKKYGSASRKDINGLIIDKLSDALDDSQKSNKIRNLIYAMSKRDKSIINHGSAKRPKWIVRN